MPSTSVLVCSIASRWFCLSANLVRGSATSFWKTNVKRFVFMTKRRRSYFNGGEITNEHAHSEIVRSYCIVVGVCICQFWFEKSAKIPKPYRQFDFDTQNMGNSNFIFRFRATHPESQRSIVLIICSPHRPNFSIWSSSPSSCCRHWTLQ